MKMPRVMTLFKGGMKANPNDYRPLHFDEIFENNYSLNYGFRKLHSIDHLLDENNYVLGFSLIFRKHLVKLIMKSCCENVIVMVDEDYS